MCVCVCVYVRACALIQHLSRRSYFLWHCSVQIGVAGITGCNWLAMTQTSLEVGPTCNSEELITFLQYEVPALFNRRNLLKCRITGITITGITNSYIAGKPVYSKCPPLLFESVSIALRSAILPLGLFTVSISLYRRSWVCLYHKREEHHHIFGKGAANLIC